MTIAHGIVVGGVPIPGTERVVRDSRAWWTEGRETRPRAGAAVDMLIGHWTAGPARTGPGAGLSLFRAMEARTNRDGEDLSVSVQLSISWDGLVWQHADLEAGCVHVGARPIIRRSIGVECMWPGTTGQAARLAVAGPSVRREIDGVRVSCLTPSDALLESWRWLCDALTGTEARALGVRIPRRTLGLRRTLGELARSPGGVGEHATLPRGAPVKIDACGLLMEATGYPSD
jgi:hypothetical protein